jgi:GNAT superfamily N-acetyltransferase
MEIREATSEDWVVIWPLVREVAAAGETFTLPRDIGEADARDMWMLKPPDRTVVAVADDGTFLGTAKMNRNHRGPASHIASASFMVDPIHSGRGVGRALGEYVLAWAREAGYRAMQFNAVVETNTRAVALWRSLGFEVMTTLPGAFQHPDHGYVGLHVMWRTL